MSELTPGLEKYLEELEDFVDRYSLPAEWFEVPDHVAVKCADAADYEAAVESFRPVAEQITEMKMSGRRLGSVKLLKGLAVASFGEVLWVELMEPRPEKLGKDVVGLEHMEFYFPDFETISDVLEQRSIYHKVQSNPGHRWVNIVINDKGQEFKLNDLTLADVVEDELKEGKLYVI